MPDVITRYQALTPRSDRETAAPQKHFTDREWQIIDGIRRDRTYAEIGEELGITKSTVRNHVNNVAFKFSNPDDLEPRVLIRLWAIHAVWANGRAQIDGELER